MSLTGRSTSWWASGPFDEAGAATERVLWPLTLLFHSHVALLGAWCELRGDYRFFRTGGSEGSTSWPSASTRAAVGCSRRRWRGSGLVGLGALDLAGHGTGRCRDLRERKGGRITTG